jgi:hypothetical protein
MGGHEENTSTVLLRGAYVYNFVAYHWMPFYYLELTAEMCLSSRSLTMDIHVTLLLLH